MSDHVLSVCVSFLCFCNGFRFSHQVKLESCPRPRRRAFRSFSFNHTAIKHFTHLLPAFFFFFLTVIFHFKNWKNVSSFGQTHLFSPWCVCLHSLGLRLKCLPVRRENLGPFLPPCSLQSLRRRRAQNGAEGWGCEVGVAWQGLEGRDANG